MVIVSETMVFSADPMLWTPPTMVSVDEGMVTKYCVSQLPS